MKHKKFLEFNGKSICFLSVDGTYWVAVKPICQALGVNYDRQYKNLKEDEILGSVYAKQHIQVPEDQGRNMVCLPEKWVYGWLLSIRSESAELREYKLTCYNLLFDYFHGTITERLAVLREKTEDDIEIERLERELKTTETYVALAAAKKSRSLKGKRLSQLDADAVRQMDINYGQEN